jgi:hypothetical protein
MPVAPRVKARVLSPLLYNQFLADACATPCTTLAANKGSNEVRPLEGSPRAAGTTFEYDPLWAPPVDLPYVPYLLGLVVRRDALDDLHTSPPLPGVLYSFPYGKVYIRLSGWCLARIYFFNAIVLALKYYNCVLTGNAASKKSQKIHQHGAMADLFRDPPLAQGGLPGLMVTKAYERRLHRRLGPTKPAPNSSPPTGTMREKPPVVGSVLSAVPTAEVCSRKVPLIVGGSP